MAVVVKTVKGDPILVGFGEFTTHFRTYTSGDWWMFAAKWSNAVEPHFKLRACQMVLSGFFAFSQSSRAQSGLFWSWPVNPLKKDS